MTGHDYLHRYDLSVLETRLYISAIIT